MHKYFVYNPSHTLVHSRRGWCSASQRSMVTVRALPRVVFTVTHFVSHYITHSPNFASAGLLIQTGARLTVGAALRDSSTSVRRLLRRLSR